MPTETAISHKEFLQKVFRNLRMSTDAALSILQKTKDETLKSSLTVQISTYESLAGRVADLMKEEHFNPSDENPIAKWTAKMGIQWNTLKDPTAPHLAQMVLEGTTMAVGEMLRAIKSAEEAELPDESIRLAREVLAYQEKICRDMQDYLKG